MPCRRLGVANAKNRALERATGEIVLFLNDDVLPDPVLLVEHARAHHEAAGDPRWPHGVSVVGHSPWLVRQADPLLHRLLRETSMVFFYDQMITPDGEPTHPPDHDWGFRHAWTLNYSAPLAALRRVRGYRPAIANCCFEDIELAWRLHEACSLPVLFRPTALAPHEHPYTPEGYLDREYRLGYSAWGFAHAAPSCARAVFGRDLTEPGSVSYFRSVADAAERDGDALLGAFVETASLPHTAIDGPHAALLLRTIACEQLPLKRAAFARGLLGAADRTRIQGLFHPLDGLPGEPDAWSGGAAEGVAA